MTAQNPKHTRQPVISKKQVIMMVIVIFAVILLLRLIIALLDSQSRNAWKWKINSSLHVAIERTGESAFHDTKETFFHLRRGDKVIITIPLDKERQIKDGVLCFQIQHSAVTLYDENGIVYSYGQKEAATNRPIGTVFARVGIPENDWGKELRLECDVKEDNALPFIHPVYIMSFSDSLHYYLIGYRADFLIFMPLLLISFVIAVCLLFYPRKSSRDVQSLLLSASHTGFLSYFMGHYGLFHVITENAVFNANIEYIGLMFGATMFFFFLAARTKAKKLKNAYALYALTLALFFVFSTVINFTTSIHYAAMLRKFCCLFSIGLVIIIIGSRKGLADEKLSRAIFRHGTLLFSFTVLVLFAISLLASYFKFDPAFPTRIVLSSLCTILMIQLTVSLFIAIMEQIISESDRHTLETLAYTDDLTGLPNRAACFRYFKGVKNTAPYSVSFLDVNGLKKMNDMHGHEWGDKLIKIVADKLSAAVGNTGFCARIGGDEFVAVIKDDAKHEMDKAMQRLESALTEYNALHLLPFDASVSYGVCVNDIAAPRDIEETLGLADDKMYEAKEAYKKSYIKASGQGSDDRTFFRT